MIETWPIVLAGVVVLAAIVTFATLAILDARRSYLRQAPLVFLGWVVFIVACPLAGPLSWFLWDGWLRDTPFGATIRAAAPSH